MRRGPPAAFTGGPGRDTDPAAQSAPRRSGRGAGAGWRRRREDDRREEVRAAGFRGARRGARPPRWVLPPSQFVCGEVWFVDDFWLVLDFGCIMRRLGGAG